MEYIETDCTVEHKSRKFTSGGAVVTPKFCIGYPGTTDPATGVRPLKDWHGKVIGTIVYTAQWETPRSYFTPRMYQAYATIDGATYTGRTAGNGMIFKGRRVAKERNNA